MNNYSYQDNNSSPTSYPPNYNSQYQPQPNSNQQHSAYPYNNNNGLADAETKKIKRAKICAIASFVIAVFLVILVMCTEFRIGIVGALAAFVLSVLGLNSKNKVIFTIIGMLTSISYMSLFLMSVFIDMLFY